MTGLDLTRNAIAEEGALWLAAALKKNSTVTSLNLFGNRIVSQGAERLAAALEQNSTVASLDPSVPIALGLRVRSGLQQHCTRTAR